MRPLIILILVLIGVSVLFVVLAVVAALIGIIEAPKAVEISSKWGDVTQESTEVLTTVVLENPNPFGISIGSGRIEADVLLNHTKVGQGALDNVSLPEGRSTKEITTIIHNSRVPEWWPSHVSNSELSDVEIRAVGSLEVLGRTVLVRAPKVTVQEIETDILSRTRSNAPEEVSAGPIAVTIVSRTFHWGETTRETTEIDGSMVVRNESEVPLPLSRLDFNVSMNGVLVAQATTADPAVLAPQSNTTIPLHTAIDNSQMLAWWPTHINNGERTSYTIDVVAVVEGDIPLLKGQSLSLHLFQYEDVFQTDFLGGEMQVTRR